MSDLSPYTTPFVLSLSTAILLWQHPEKSRNFWIFCVVAFVVGMFAEWLGVKTGFPFGNYQYVYGLGIKLAGVPLIIGVNWLLLILASRATAASFGIEQKFLPLITAVFMVFIDLFLEVVAVKMGWWHWFGKPVPFTNYLAWFGISMILAWIAQWLKVDAENKSGRPIYFMLLIFLFFMMRT